MPAPVSVIIPTLNAADRIGPTLGGLASGLTEGLICELILADGGSKDDIAGIADAAGATLVKTAPGRGTQLAAGVAAARGDWFLILHADTVLPDGWPDMLRAHMRARPDRAGWFRLGFDDPGLPARIVAGWANLRSRLLGLPYGDQGLFLPRKLYSDAGGYPAIPLMEDVALARKLRGRMTALPGRVTTGADRYRAEGWLRRGSANLWTLLRYLFGADPETLARSYGAQSNHDNS
ncbi:TIGR04283 family arsenosugar biosynthesis glycosyltransferase [Oceanomicrobium pacificus]|uniref:Glycosyltransferase n=1 Tax=Oceanomicrobium pacificus TaxID=2692916 RepID=A0A6B0U571_9RHOB|nr:TIGR04283 family arsenosugar biosynthesis glycosyltransferase [Oceanomicrobium pacificus]MXU66081.1 glycosyltransferase [Oceanomicrobium pacificus]